MIPDPSRLGRGRSRTITPENPTGRPGGGARATTGTGAEAARDLGIGWKVSPSIDVGAGQRVTLASVEGPGRINRIWLTSDPRRWRELVLRASWDDAATPAILAPIADMFCQGWSQFVPVTSAVITAAPYGGLTSYWPMPFRQSAHLELENLGAEPARVYFEVDLEEGEQADDSGYLHAEWRRSPRVSGGVHRILETSGRGSYVGTYLAIAPTSDGWWGEGEVSFFIDEDTTHPSVRGTGTEDYVGGAWNFDVPEAGYTTFSAPYSGLPQATRPDGRYIALPRFGLYRWHLPDPVTFTTGLRVEIQSLGWAEAWRYRIRDDDIASLAWWYLDSAEGRGAEVNPDAVRVHLGDGPASSLPQ